MMAVDYDTHRLECGDTRYHSSTARRNNRFRKSLDVQMRAYTLSFQETMKVLGFCACFKNACEHKRMIKGPALCFPQFYLNG